MDEAKLLGYSDNTPVEIFSINENFLCLQCHPEFNAFLQETFVIREFFEGCIRVTPEFHQESVLANRGSTEGAKSLDRNFLLAIIRNFLHRDV